MSSSGLGDGPIEPGYERMMVDVARSLDALFNGDLQGGIKEPRETGFVLLVFPYGEGEGRCNYISNGADRSDIATMLEEQAKRFREAGA